MSEKSSVVGEGQHPLWGKVKPFPQFGRIEPRMGMDGAIFSCFLCKQKNLSPLQFGSWQELSSHKREAHSAFSIKVIRKCVPENEPALMPSSSTKMESEDGEIDESESSDEKSSSEDEASNPPSPAPVEVKPVEGWEAIRQLIGRKEENERDLRRQLSKCTAEYLDSVEKEKALLLSSMTHVEEQTALQQENRKLQLDLEQQKRKHEADWNHAMEAQRSVLSSTCGAQEKISSLEKDLERSRMRCKRKDEEIESLRSENKSLKRKLKSILVNVTKLSA